MTGAAWMSERLGRAVAVQRGWDYVQRLGHSVQVLRQRHVHADHAAQEQYTEAPPRERSHDHGP
jgi:hypothetical protein